MLGAGALDYLQVHHAWPAATPNGRPLPARPPAEAPSLYFWRQKWASGVMKCLCTRNSVTWRVKGRRQGRCAVCQAGQAGAAPQAHLRLGLHLV